MRRVSKLTSSCLAIFLTAPFGGGECFQAQAAVPKYVVPIRWCVLKGAPLETDPDLARPQSETNPGFLEDTEDLAAENESRAMDARISPDAALRYRSGNQYVIDSYTRSDGASIAFQSTTPNSKLTEGRLANSSPILYSSNWNWASGKLFGVKMADECQKAWQGGDAIYMDMDNSNCVSVGDLRLEPGLDSSGVALRVEDSCEPNFGAPLERFWDSQKMPGVKYGYVDLNGSKAHEEGEPVYRYKLETEEPADPNDPICSTQRCVTREDVLLYPTADPGPVLPRDVVPDSVTDKYLQEYVDKKRVIVPLDESDKIKYVDLITIPGGEFSIGYGTLEATGIYAVSMDDYEMFESGGAQCSESGAPPKAVTHQASPVHGQVFGDYSQVFDFGLRMLEEADFEILRKEKTCVPQHLVVDDPHWMYSSGQYADFESILVAHELGHALGLPHGDGLDNSGNGSIDDLSEDGCFLPDQTPPGFKVCAPTSGEPRGDGGARVKRTTCFVEPPIDRESKDQANMMQYCWNFSQDASLRKTRDGGDRNFRGKLVFSDLQYEAMQKYADACGFKVEIGDPESADFAGASGLASNRSRRVSRVDGSRDTLVEESEWLDIGRYGYRLTDRDEDSGQALELRVTFPENLDGAKEAFELWFGVGAGPKLLEIPKRDDGEPVAPVVRTNENSLELFEGSSVFVRAQIDTRGSVKLEFRRSFDGALVTTELEGVQGFFEAVEIPNGFAPPNYEGSLVYSHSFRLVFPEGSLPEELGKSTSLLIAAINQQGRVADFAYSSGLVHIPPQPPGSPGVGVIPTNPTCVVTNLDGSGLEQMPREGRLKIEARGLTPNRPVLLDVNGVRVQDVEPFKKDPAAKLGDAVKTNDEGTVVLLVDGDQVPFDANRESGAPAIISVGAGASTAICGFEFFDSAGQLTWNCDYEAESGGAPGGEEGNPFYCEYDDLCELGNFGYVKPSGSTCPDGSLAEAAQRDEPIISGRQGEPLCLVPLSSSGQPNCINVALNMPPGADWSVRGLGLAYNFMLWKEDGRPCTNRSLAKFGLDLNSDLVRGRCLVDSDSDGIPDPIDWCPTADGFRYFYDRDKKLKFHRECSSENGRKPN